MPLSRGLKIVLGGWTAFAGSHLALSHPPIRSKLIESTSEGQFRGLHSALTCSIIGASSYLYNKTPKVARGPLLHSLSKRSGVVAGSCLLKVIGALFVVDAIITPFPGPSTMDDLRQIEVNGEAKKKRIRGNDKVMGLTRVTRHPLLFGFATLGLANMMTTPLVAPFVFWAGFPVFYAVAGLHQDYRQRHYKPASYYEETSFLPYVAIYEGRNSGSRAAAEVTAQAYATALCTIFFVLVWP